MSDKKNKDPSKTQPPPPTTPIQPGHEKRIEPPPTKISTGKVVKKK